MQYLPTLSYFALVLFWLILFFKNTSLFAPLTRIGKWALFLSAFSNFLLFFVTIGDLILPSEGHPPAGFVVGLFLGVPALIGISFASILGTIGIFLKERGTITILVLSQPTFFVLTYLFYRVF